VSNQARMGNYQGCGSFHSPCVCNNKKFVRQEWRKAEPSYFIAKNMDGTVTCEGISLITQDISFTKTKNYENPHVAKIELHPISERALAFNDRTKNTFGEFDKPSDEMVFYGNVFDTYVYASRFDFEDKDKHMPSMCLTHKFMRQGLILKIKTNTWTRGNSINMV
jgi:hypothetical protein